ncbi:MAG TPA: hypothetical protein VFM95_09400 [Microcella sp.]|nr:hypothetical protein [Microcella sp.]
MSTWWRRSAQDVDTLSWLTASLVTAWVPLIIVLLGAGGVVLGGQGAEAPVYQWVAIALAASGTLVIHRAGRPTRRRFGLAPAIAVALLASAAVLTSAWGIARGGAGAADAVVPELWWAPVAAALVVMSLSPFVPGRVFLPAGVMVAGASILAAVLVTEPLDAVSPGAEIVIAASSPLFALIGGTFLTRLLIEEVEAWRAGFVDTLAAAPLREPAVRVVDRATRGALTEEALPFLAAIADGASVGPAEREHAARLATQLRTALVDRDGSGWLGAVIARRAVHVTDPHRLADRVSLDQRAAILALIDGVFADEEAGVYSARLELAPGADSQVAVALTLDLALPEGRRTAVLAPYYLSAKSVVRDISWTNGRSLVVRFDVDGER